MSASGKEVDGAAQAEQAGAKKVTMAPNKEELVASTPNERNWRGILIALLVICAVLGLIVFSIVLLSPPDEGPRVKGRKFTLEDVLGPHFAKPTFNGTWVSGSELVYRNVLGGVALFNAENLTTTVLMTNATFRRLNAVDFKASYDLKFILLIADVKKVFKYSFEAVYSIYEVRTSIVTPLTLPGVDAEHLSLQHVTWAPTGNALVFVYRGDVYYKPRAKDKRVLRLTDTGQPGVVFNGIPDWLYEEEILKSATALWFSPDSQFLSVACFNDTLVGELKYPWYGSVTARTRYPQIHTLRYPKAGTTNPAVTLSVFRLSSLVTTNTTLLPTSGVGVPIKPATDVTPDSYVTAVTWLATNDLAVVWLNRKQNVSTISVCRRPDWRCSTTHTQRSGLDGWVDIVEPPIFSSDGGAYIARLPVLDGENGYYKHVCFVDVASKQQTPLTSGQFEVTRVLSWDEENHVVYFEATPVDHPEQRHLYRVGDLNSSLSVREYECLTCPNEFLETSPSPEPGDNLTSYETEQMTGCLFGRHHLSRAASPRFYVQECLGPEVPYSTLLELPSNMRLMTLDSNSELRERYAAMARPQIKIIKVVIESGYQAQVRLFLPPGLREYEEMQFPMILQVCGTPGGQLVTEQWSTDWATYLASSRNFIVAQIDGRGSGFQGDKFLHEIHNHLGSVEIEDQIAVVKFVRDNFKFVDKARMAVWGWSYGGFASAMILAQDTGIFGCGIAVAPVTSWAYYDSAFSERYMGVPADNYRNYDEADVTKKAGNLRDKSFLLIHGTADDTVHYQQSMLLVKALTKEGVLFRHQTYPDEGHTFSGVQDHFYKAMGSFLDECFGPLDFEEWEVGTSFFTFKQ